MRLAFQIYNPFFGEKVSARDGSDRASRRIFSYYNRFGFKLIKFTWNHFSFGIGIFLVHFKALHRGIYDGGSWFKCEISTLTVTQMQFSNYRLKFRH